MMDGSTVAAKPTPQVTKLPHIDGCSGSVTRPLHRPPPSYLGLSAPGPAYSLSGIPEKFKLPPASVLQPGVEHNSGDLDSWPAHAIRPAPSNLSIGQSPGQKLGHYRTQPKQPLPRSSLVRGVVPDMGLPTPKPKFLEQLEHYLQKELRLLGCPPCGPHELRLQAHREIFEYLIEDFKTYKPLLSAIKNEYELFLDHQQDTIRELEPMKAELEAVKEKCERKIMALREEEREEETSVLRENKRLLGVIQKMRTEELSYQAQVEKLQAEVAHLYEQYRNEADARKILISDYNDLKYRQQEQKSEEAGPEEREDPVVLKLKLARAREDLRASNLRITTMLADYGDVVPRREFEMMETSYKNLESEVESLKGNHVALVEEHSTLQALYKEVLSQHDRATDELSRLKRSATPRPDWERCASYLEGGPERWPELSQGRSSDQLLDVLLAQIAGVDVSELARDDTFQGQGTGEQVPLHLRAEGEVRNRRIGREEVNSLISGFWQHRLTSQNPTQPLDESLYAYLLSRNEESESLAVEDGYNLQEACSRFAHEPHVGLFSGILNGEVEEGVFHSWVELQTTLIEALNQQQQPGREGEEGVVTLAVLEQVLAAKLPAKPPAHLKALLSTAVQLASPQPGVVNFLTLMSPEPDGQPSQFVLLLLEQSRHECKEFVAELVQELGNRSEVTLAETRAALQSLDPAKPPGELNALLARGFQLNIEQIPEAGEVSSPVARLVERLRNGDTQRTGPKPA